MINHKNYSLINLEGREKKRKRGGEEEGGSWERKKKKTSVVIVGFSGQSRKKKVREIALTT